MRIKIFTGGGNVTPLALETQVNAWLVATDGKIKVHHIYQSGTFDHAFGFTFTLSYSPIEANPDDVDVDHGIF